MHVFLNLKEYFSKSEKWKEVFVDLKKKRDFYLNF